MIHATASLPDVVALTRGSPGWPEPLNGAAPVVRTLYTMGNLDTLRPPLCAVVGTRLCTDYGVRVTRQLVTALVSADVGIVSGMARGIDAAAHRAALDAGGRTIAVMGTGVDVPYPTGHRELHARIARDGLVVSETAPGTKATQGCFPKRNRIIAALAPVTLVVEAGFKSGAQSTANAALEIDRVVAAIPGPIDSPQSAGTNALIAAGAQIITCAGDLFALLQLPPPSEERIEHTLRGDALAVWRALADGAVLCEDLAPAADIPLSRTLSAITELEIAGHVTVGLDDRVRRVVPLVRA
ncbi:MAG TPA: DNA-processing protein DprA [Gemmatimonadaceae bacterium]|nr:DNA-processing protein DprA [Gemmatimonadaceae bacterium]